MQEPIVISGLHLDARKDRIFVSVEIDGQWVKVLDEPQVLDGGHISHIVEPSGIRLCAIEGKPR